MAKIKIWRVYLLRFPFASRPFALESLVFCNILMLIVFFFSFSSFGWFSLVSYLH
jgi:hypothetical protein